MAPSSDKVVLNEVDARILALEQDLAGSDTGGDARDESASNKAARKEAKAARKQAKAASKEAAASGADDSGDKAARKEAKAASKEAAADGADGVVPVVPVTEARMFSVHAGETVHFSGRKPGDPKPKRGSKKRAREATEDAPTPLPRWSCELCSIEVNSEDLLEEHMDGWKHAAMVASKVARAAGLYCEVRSNYCQMPNRRPHSSTLPAGTRAEVTSHTTRPALIRPRCAKSGCSCTCLLAYSCTVPATQVCSLGFTGKEQMDDHLKGGRHRGNAAAGASGKGKKGGKGKDGKGKDGKGGKGKGKDGKGDKGGKGGKGGKSGGKGGSTGAVVRQWS